MTKNDGSPEDKAQANDRELGRKRIQSLLVVRGLPATDAAVRSWEETLWNGDFSCDDYAVAIEKVLALAAKDGAPVPRYVREATKWLAKICPKYYEAEPAPSPAKTALAKMEEKIRKEQQELKERVLSDPVITKDYLALRKRMGLGKLSPEAQALKDRLESKRDAKAQAMEERTPAPDPDAIAPMSEEEAAALDAQAGAEMIEQTTRTAPVAPEPLPDVAPQSGPKFDEEDMPW